MDKEIYFVNRKKAFVKRLFNKENIFLTPKFSLVRNFDDNGNCIAQHIRNRFGDRIEFFLFNLKDNIEFKFIVTDTHERLHRFIGKELKKSFQDEENIVRKMCEYVFDCKYI